MNSKAIRKQLLAAVAMVLVAAVALGSSTYAWFVASGTVKAEGMKVQAQSDGGLVINYHGGAWGASATAGMTQKRDLKPTSTKDLQNWYTARAAAPNAATANLATGGVVTSSFAHSTGKDDSDNGEGCYNNPYGLVKWFEIRSATKENIPKGLCVESIDVSGKSKNMSTALRVGVACTYKDYSQNDSDAVTTYNIYAPVSLDETDTGNQPSKEYNVIEPKEGGGYQYSTTKFKVSDVGKGTAIVPSTIEISNTNATTVYIYVWFEGEDHNLFSDNFNSEELSVTVNFTSLA